MESAVPLIPYPVHRRFDRDERQSFDRTARREALQLRKSISPGRKSKEVTSICNSRPESKGVGTFKKEVVS